MTQRHAGRQGLLIAVENRRLNAGKHHQAQILIRSRAHLSSLSLLSSYNDKSDRDESMKPAASKAFVERSSEDE